MMRTGEEWSMTCGERWRHRRLGVCAWSRHSALAVQRLSTRPNFWWPMWDSSFSCFVFINRFIMITSGFVGPRHCIFRLFAVKKRLTASYFHDVAFLSFGFLWSTVWLGTCNLCVFLFVCFLFFVLRIEPELIPIGRTQVGKTADVAVIPLSVRMVALKPWRLHVSACTSFSAIEICSLRTSLF